MKKKIGLHPIPCTAYLIHVHQNAYKQYSHAIEVIKKKSISTFQWKTTFREFFREADICFLSSHTEGPAHEDIEEIINQLKMRCYNVAGIFWSNSFNKEAMRISLLPWQERLWISNPRFDSKEEISAQLIRIAHNFSELLIQRAHTQ